MGLAQHHDGISGTEKQEVVFDYAQRLSIGIDNTRVSILLFIFILNIHIRMLSINHYQNFFRKIVLIQHQ